MDLQRGNMYLIKRGLTMRHLSPADRATRLLGPEGKLPSSSPPSTSPSSSSAVANGVYGSEVVGTGSDISS